MRNDLHVIIPAGGAGTRLWPLSRRNHPKFLLDLTGTGRTLLQTTVDRLEPVAASISIITGAQHRAGVLEQLPEFSATAESDRTLLIEPSGRDSMAAIGLAAYIIRARFGDDALVGSFAADHLIARPDLLLEAIESAAQAAQDGFVSTIGISPTDPSTAYGYIHPEAALPGISNAQRVAAFVEKPDEQTATRYVSQGFVWNAGMFIIRAGTLADHLAKLMPQMHEHLWAIASTWGTDAYETTLIREWLHLPRIAIDHAIAEPVAAEGGVAVVRADENLGWTDLGDYAALAGVTSRSDDVVRIDSDGAAVFSLTGQKVVLVGLPNVGVAVTDDAILITELDTAQDVKKAVDVLNTAADEHLL